MTFSSELKAEGQQAEHADALALTRLLIRKGVFTLDELVKEKSNATMVSAVSMRMMNETFEKLNALDEVEPSVVEGMFVEIGNLTAEYLRNGTVPE